MEERQERSSGSRSLIATGTALAFLLGGVGLIGAAIASQTTVTDPPSTHENANTVAAQDEPRRPRTNDPLQLAHSKPVTLDIAAIGVHSVIRDLGRTAEGALETPEPGPHYNDAAWYRHSPTPGELGPAILLGHVDSASDGPSVFFRLGQLRRGDRVSVTRADGSVATFEVDEVRRYPKDAFPTELVYGDIDHAGLRILTCGGPFDEVSGHYLDNIVVFASLASAQSP